MNPKDSKLDPTTWKPLEEEKRRILAAGGVWPPPAPATLISLGPLQPMMPVHGGGEVGERRTLTTTTSTAAAAVSSSHSEPVSLTKGEEEEVEPDIEHAW